jgi:hypothetical protein
MPSFRKKGLRLDPKHQETTRAKISASGITTRLVNHVLGKVEMSATQVTAGIALLRKIIPDLSAVEHQGEQATFVMRLPEPAVDTATWERNTSVSVHGIVGSESKPKLTH